MQAANVPQSRGSIAKSVSIVVPLFNEQRHVDLLAQRLTNVLDSIGLNWSVLFIDDGSRDDTFSRVRAITGADSRFGALALSRNFGKEASIAAGLRRAAGDAVIVMDADSQHPPEIIPQFIEAWRAGNLVVFGQRQGRLGENAPRRWSSHLFYRLFRLISETPIPDGATDFILLDRRAIAAVNSLGERSRFTKGLCAWIGFRSTTILFRPGARDGDASRFNFVKLGRLALVARVIQNEGLRLRRMLARADPRLQPFALLGAQLHHIFLVRNLPALHESPLSRHRRDRDSEKHHRFNDAGD